MNYARHGFANIITDLENKRTEELSSVFRDFDIVIATLRVLDENELRRRVMDKSRSSGYRDWQKAVQINRRLLARLPFPNEHFIDVTAEPAEDVARGSWGSRDREHQWFPRKPRAAPAERTGGDRTGQYQPGSAIMGPREGIPRARLTAAPDEGSSGRPARTAQASAGGRRA
jgi:hypothetical protein